MRSTLLFIFLILSPDFANAGEDGDSFINQGGRNSSGNLVNPRTGEVMVPTRPNYTGTRDGTVYVAARPHGVIDTRSGRYVPTN